MESLLIKKLKLEERMSNTNEARVRTQDLVTRPFIMTTGWMVSVLGALTSQVTTS